MAWVYPSINPVAFSFGPVHIHWYALMYLAGFGLAWMLGLYRSRKPASGWTSEQVADLIFYSAVGVIIGGRLGYMLFYDTRAILDEPWQIVKIWEGGMSFHGGLIGVLTAMFCFARKWKMSFLKVTDFLVPLVPLGLAAGRTGNFINGELWGRVMNFPHSWGIIYPHVDDQIRHPSQLYEFSLEGIVLFIILWLYTSKPRPLGASSGLFLLLYGAFRGILECFREPDMQLGFLWQEWLTMGQLLSLPMILLGAILLIRAYYRRRRF